MILVPHDSNEDCDRSKMERNTFTPHLKSGYVPLLLPEEDGQRAEGGSRPTRAPSALTTSNRRLSPYFTEAIKIKLRDLGKIRFWELPPHHQVNLSFRSFMFMMPTLSVFICVAYEELRIHSVLFFHMFAFKNHFILSLLVNPNH